MNVPRYSFSISAVMPVYNEEGNIEVVIRDFCTNVLSHFDTRELIIINDASKDATLAKLERLQQEYPYLRIVSHRQNKGHGPSVWEGLSVATGEYVLQSDSDNQVDPQDFWKLWEAMEKNSLDVAIGYRKQRKDPFIRIIVTNILKILVFVLFGVKLADSNSPFRLYKREALRGILAKIPQDPLVPSILMAVTAKKTNMRLELIQIRHKPRTSGKGTLKKMRLLKFSLRAFLELWRQRVVMGK